MNSEIVSNWMNEYRFSDSKEERRGYSSSRVFGFQASGCQGERRTTFRRVCLEVSHRMIPKMKLVVLLLIAILAFKVSAENGGGLNGTWVVDAMATETFILEMAPRSDAAEIARAFIAAGPYLAGMQLVVEDEVATISTYGDTNNRGKKFKLLSQSQADRKYIATEAKDLSKEGLTVTVLNNENIRVHSQNDPLGPFVSWKRVPPQTQQTRGALDMHQAAWLVSLQKIKELLFAQDIKQTAAVRPDRWSEDAALHDGRQVKVEREVSYTFEHSVGDAGSGFAVFKSKISTFRFQFRHPQTGEIIVWQGVPHVRPVLLDVVDGTPYLVLVATPTKEIEPVYGCSDLPFVYLAYDSKSSKTWRPINVDRAPMELRRANLSLEDPARLKDHLSVTDVRATNERLGSSKEQYFQPEIPRTYGEWRYVYKNSYRNERRRGDCRPPPAPLQPVVLPAPIEGMPEILETIDYVPDRIAVGDDWASLVFDQKREGECKKLFRPTDPDDYMQGQRFVKDSSGKKSAPYSQSAQFNMGVRVLCDDDVWFVTHQEERGKIVISKFTVTGDLVYRTSFRNPDRMEGFTGYIRVPSLRSEGGDLYFDWLDFRDVNREWHIKRWLKMRMKEPRMP